MFCELERVIQTQSIESFQSVEMELSLSAEIRSNEMYLDLAYM